MMFSEGDYIFSRDYNDIGEDEMLAKEFKRMIFNIKKQNEI